MQSTRRLPVALTPLLATLVVVLAALLAPIRDASAAGVSPDPPTGVTASPGNTQATVNWTAPASAGLPGSTITGYTVTSTPGSLTATTTGATKATVTGLTNGTAYTFTVTATNSLGSMSAASGASNSVTPFGVPGKAGNVAAASGDRKATVTWTAADANGPGPVTYGVTVSPSPTGVGITYGDLSATVTGLTNGSPYMFTVEATNGADELSTSDTATTTPAALPTAPSAVNASRGKMSAAVTWKAATPNGAAITAYTVTASPGGVTATTTGATSATVTGLADGTSYTFTVTATNSVGTGPASPVSNAVVPGEAPNPPTGVTGVRGDTVATVSWTAPVSTGDAIDSYTVTASPGPRTAKSNGAATTVQVSGLTNGTSYTFTVTASAGGGTSLPSAASAGVVPAGAPKTPLTPFATAGNMSATVSFDPANGNGAAITSYTVTASPAGGGVPVVITDASSPAILTGLANGTAYAVTVTAINAVGSTTSAATTVTPAAPSTGPAPAPAPTGPAVVTLTLDKTFVVNGSPVQLSGSVTQGGVAAPAGTPVGVNVVYSDGKAVVLTVTSTDATGFWSATLVPVYDGVLTASSLGANSAAVPSKVILTFTTVTATVNDDGQVTLKASSAPGFITGAHRAERAQVLLLDANGKVMKVLATINASQRHPAAHTQHGVNDLVWKHTFDPGTYRLAIKVIGTPVNTGAQTVSRTVTISGGITAP